MEFTTKILDKIENNIKEYIKKNTNPLFNYLVFCLSLIEDNEIISRSPSISKSAAYMPRG